MTSVDDILAQVENPAFIRVATGRVLLRQDLLARHKELDEALTKAIEYDRMTNEDDTHPAIREQIDALEAEVEAAKIEFRFRSIGHKAWFDLIAKHPPTKDQKKADGRLDHDPTTFPVVAMAASCSVPEGVTEDFFRTLEKSPNVVSTVFDYLWAKCIEANVGGLEDPKSVAAGVIRQVSERSANTRAPAASPEASSSAG